MIRFETHAAGYSLVRADGEDTADGRRRYVAIHRLIALADGEIDALTDEVEVHHLSGVPFDNAASNLVALSAEEHGRVTRRDAAQRAARADGGRP